MTTATQIVEEVITAHEFVLPCELPLINNSIGRYIGGCGGANPAEWILHTKKCCIGMDPHVLYCTRCKDFVMTRAYLWCANCRTRFVPPSNLFHLIEPLGRPA